MSFRRNESQQMTFSDTLWGLTPREKKALENSWAKTFAEDVFPTIDEERFSVLYSTKASRPNTPVNVILGALTLKELFDLSDNEVVENLLLDPRFQYALHTTSFQEQPISDKTLTRFRQRCYEYEAEKGVDLYHEYLTDLSAKTAKLMNIDGRIRRMDSLMVESNIRRLSRMELLYRCTSKLVTWLHKNNHDDLIKGLEHYYDPSDFNQVIYHSRSSEVEDRLRAILNDIDTLLDRCGYQFCGLREFDLFLRAVSEQTEKTGEKREMRQKGDPAMNSNSMQSPADPDATYREKAGQQHRGYVANVEESVSENGSVVTDFQFKPNNESDSSMLKEHLEKMGPQDEEVTIVADGAYSGKDNRDLAAQNNVKLITTDLSGKDVPEIIGFFVLNEDGTKVLKCPAGNEPRSSSFISQSDTCTASFDRSLCENCPHKKECKAKIYKRVAKIRVTAKQIDRARLQKEMQTDEFKNYGRLRNGVETIPSILKNEYHANKMPVRGYLRAKFFFGSKIAALNFRKLFRYRKGLGRYAKNPVLA